MLLKKTLHAKSKLGHTACSIGVRLPYARKFEHATVFLSTVLPAVALEERRRHWQRVESLSVSPDAIGFREPNNRRLPARARSLRRTCSRIILQPSDNVGEFMFSEVGRTRRTLFAVLALMALSPAVAQPAPLRIGYLAVFSGPSAALGQDMYDAFMLVVERNGGKLGGVPVEIHKEDDQAKPDVATQAVQRLIQKDQVQVVAGLTYSNVLMAVYPVVTGSKVVLIGGNAGPAPIAGKLCSPYGFIASRQNELPAEAMGSFATKQGLKRVVLLGANYQAGKEMLEGFKRTFKGTVVDELYTPLSQIDFSAELAQIAASNADAAFAFFPGALGVAFVRQYRQAGLADRLKLLSVGTVDGLTLPGLQDAALGLYSASVWATDSQLPTSVTFVREFEKKTGRIPSDLAATSYDSALLLDAALAKVKGDISNNTAFLTALKSVSYQSVRGNIRFGNNNFPIQDVNIMQVAKDDKGRVSLKRVATALTGAQDLYHDQCPLR